MVKTAPNGFSIKDFYKDIYTFQSWEVFPGHKTKGPKDVALMCDAMGLPKDLTGKRVLDIGPWNGFFGFECLRRGAENLTSFGPDDPDITGYNKTVEVLGITDNVTYIRDSVYNLKSSKKFDVVLFLGVVYHLRHPLLAMDLCHNVCGDLFFLDSPVIDNIYQRHDIDNAKAIAKKLSEIKDHALLYFTKGVETGDPFNWFFPNTTALLDMAESCGFAPFKVTKHGGEDTTVWVSVGCKKTKRPFEEGTEGHNPTASKYESNNK